VGIAIHKDVRHSHSTRRKMMTTVLTEQCAKSAEDAPPGDSPGCLFVSTSLTTCTTATPEQFARDFQLDDTVYRRLDPDYYAWLRSRMALAKKAATSGHLPPAAFELLRVRFNAVHEFAVGHFSEASLLIAVRTFRSGGYDPPVAEDEGRHVPVTAARKPAADCISPGAMSLVDSISERALSLGWKRQRLYAAGRSRVLDPERGLVCFLKAGDRIGQVTRQSIELVGPPPLEVRQRFYNPDVDQPWIKRIAREIT
jgi:hypothetical protein